jgi:hypothetical protein
MLRRGSVRLLAAVLASLTLCLACARAPRLQDAAASGVWGYLRIVPHEGIASPAGAYSDRRYAHAELVDYSSPGFAVVYLEGEPPDTAASRLTLRDGLGGTRVDPPHAAVGVGNEVEVVNETDEAHVVTCPALGLVHRLEPAAVVRFPANEAGEFDVYLPGSRSGARVFAAPGPWSLVNAAGRYEILGVRPGSRLLHAWHVRFPPSRQEISLPRGSALRVDLEVGVGLPSESR